MVAPPRASATAQRNRRGAWFGVAACMTSLAGAAVCEGKPTVAQIDGYTITLPPGWETNAESSDGVTLASLDSFADDVECQVQVYAIPLERDAFMRIAHNSMSANNIAPASLDTGLGRLEGTTFTGKIPADSAIGKLAQLAGTPHGEAYFGGPAEKPVGVFIMTFASDDAATRKRLRDKCANAIATLRR
jgi:hypothetical protein